MFSLLRNRLGIPGLISVIALVLAMGGGAYAANGSGDGATASAKNRKGGGNVNKLIKREARKFSKRFSARFSKRFPGPIGPRGFPGLPGAPGEDGDDGDDGDDGSDGSDGAKGATGATGATGPTGAAGDEGPTGPTGPTGPEGSPWTAGGTLPAGETLTGTWSFALNQSAAAEKFGGEKVIAVPISFPIQLEENLAADHTIYDPPSGSENCPGATQAPAAKSGYLCVYPSAASNAEPSPALIGGLGSPFLTPIGTGGSLKSGTVLWFNIPEAGSADVSGTWAVTG